MRIKDGLRAFACDNEGVFGSASEDVERNRLGREHGGLGLHPTINERWWFVQREV